MQPGSSVTCGPRSQGAGANVFGNVCCTYKTALQLKKQRKPRQDLSGVKIHKRKSEKGWLGKRLKNPGLEPKPKRTRPGPGPTEQAGPNPQARLSGGPRPTHTIAGGTGLH